MKKVPGDKINLCIRNELRDTQDASAEQQQQDNNNNYNGTTTTTTTTQWAQVVILLKMGNCDKLCNWGNLSLFAHIAAQCHAGKKGERVRHKGRGEGGRVCLHFFKNTLCALMAAVLRGSLLNRVFYALFYLCKIMFQLNETRAVIARNYIRATTAILCCCCPVHTTPLLHPPFMRKDSWRTAAMRCN